MPLQQDKRKRSYNTLNASESKLVLDSTAQALLQHSIREQLKTLTAKTLTDSERTIALREAFSEAVAMVLSTEQLVHETVTQLFESMYQHAIASMNHAKINEQMMTQEFLSPTGFVMSPLNCSTTIKDVYRIARFVRGIDSAITRLLEKDEHIRILYPACGPFAPLLLPLISHYKSGNQFSDKSIKITLVDVQPGAILSLQQLVMDLQITEYIEDIVEEDATKYQPNGEFDLLIIEAMQHGFTKEGHWSIARHLVQFLNLGGTLIPNQVSVSAMMVNPETEFNQQWKRADFTHSSNRSDEALDDRIDLGVVLTINQSTLLAAETITLPSGIEVVPGSEVLMPKGIADMSERLLTLYTSVHVHACETLSDYDSGITHPKPDMNFYLDAQPSAAMPEHFVVSGGDCVQFFYQLSGLPGFTMVKQESIQ
ncbi:hypothetical protein [Vibrio sp. 10N]|uniref:hypothetical protein n=1 Tax=Vibrio sp. 10N TaxID=3058938 RepID=UPI002812D86E|nr:hypothetical protein VB10N_45820 [Vibrio sp. 10N]